MSDDTTAIPGPPSAAEPPPGSAPLGRFPWPGERAHPYLGTSVAAGGGVLIVIGAIALAADLGSTDDGFNQGPGVVISAMLLAASLALIRMVPVPTRAACVAVAATAVPALCGFLFLADGPDEGALRAFQVTTIVGWFVIFFISTMRARALFLGLALYASWQFVTFEVGDVGSNTFAFPAPALVPPLYPSGSEDFTFDSDDPVENDITFDEDGTIIFPLDDYPIEDDPFSDDFDTGGSFGYPDEPSNDTSLEVGLVSAIFGVGYLLAMRRCDRRAEFAIGTGFAATGTLAVALAVGSLGIWLDSLAGAGLIAVIGGTFCAWAGAGRRRWTTWFGAFVGSVGALLVSGDAADSGDGDGSVAVFAWLTMALGAGLALTAVGLARLLGEPGTPPEPSRPDLGTHPTPPPNLG